MKESNPAAERLLSLDFMRGFIMVMLMLESTRLFERLVSITEKDSLSYKLMLQFFHHPWDGLRFWDLIQPGFMFIAGTALAYSLHRQGLAGVPWRDSFKKALKRSAWLFFWGVMIYAVGADGLSFSLWNVLTQLSFTMLVAFLIFRWSLPAQLGVSIFILILTEVLFRFTNVPGFSEPFVNQRNFGNYVDLLLMNKINPNGWVAINCISTSCHTIWGAMAGKLLLSGRAGYDKIVKLAAAGIAAIAAGYLLDITATPIIKRIATSSFVLVTGGWCLAALAFLYWRIDIRKKRKYLTFFTIVGMNSLFIYLFFEIVGRHWFNGYIDAISAGFFGFARVPEVYVFILSSVVIFMLEWRLCYFLFRKKLFFKV